jgi:hypothetical protein
MMSSAGAALLPLIAIDSAAGRPADQHARVAEQNQQHALPIAR